MISISSQYAEGLGLSVEDINASSHLTGVYACRMLSFGARGDGVRRTDDSFAHVRDLLAAEPAPRRLLLVGRSDRYGEGAQLATVTEIGIDDSAAAGPKERPLHAEERERLGALVREHARDADLAMRILRLPGAAGALDRLGMASDGCQSCGGVSGRPLHEIPTAYLEAVRSLPPGTESAGPDGSCWTCRALLAAGVDPTALVA